MIAKKKSAFFEEALRERKKHNRLRELTHYECSRSPVILSHQDKTYINFSSNDYLGLSRHPEIIEASERALHDYGSGSGASRLVTGSYNLLQKLEKRLAEFTHREAALVFNSGYQANATILKAVTDRNSVIFLDKLVHNSLLHGALASRADMYRFRHNDIRHLQKLLKKHRKQYQQAWIVTESLFSMEGDFAPLYEINALAKEYDALTYVDEAHAIGLYGQDGSGLAGNLQEIDIILGTFGKALGSYGAFVACSRTMKKYLVNFCEGFIYTTALPPAVTGAIYQALTLMPTLQKRRDRLKSHIEYLLMHISKAGYSTGNATSQIMPVIIGNEENTLALSNYLKSEGMIATAIRPPTVPENASRIRITVSSEHTEQHLNRFIQIMRNWNEKKD